MTVERRMVTFSTMTKIMPQQQRRQLTMVLGRRVIVRMQRTNVELREYCMIYFVPINISFNMSRYDEKTNLILTCPISIHWLYRFHHIGISHSHWLIKYDCALNLNGNNEFASDTPSLFWYFACVFISVLNGTVFVFECWQYTCFLSFYLQNLSFSWTLYIFYSQRRTYQQPFSKQVPLYLNLYFRFHWTSSINMFRLNSVCIYLATYSFVFSKGWIQTAMNLWSFDL